MQYKWIVFLACRRWYLSVVQVTEASDDLLLVELVSFELHAPHRLHGAVILQALLPRQLCLHRRALLQAVQVAFLHQKQKHHKLEKKTKPKILHFWSTMSEVLINYTNPDLNQRLAHLLIYCWIHQQCWASCSLSGQNTDPSGLVLMIMTLKLLLMWFDSVWQQNQLYKYSHDILSERTVCALTLISFILPSSCYVLSYIRYRLRCLTDRSFMGVKIPFLQSAIAISDSRLCPPWCQRSPGVWSQRRSGRQQLWLPGTQTQPTETVFPSLQHHNTT